MNVCCLIFSSTAIKLKMMSVLWSIDDELMIEKAFNHIGMYYFLLHLLCMSADLVTFTFL